MGVQKCKWFIIFALLAAVLLVPRTVGAVDPPDATMALPQPIRIEAPRIQSSFELGARNLRIATYNIHYGADAAGAQNLQGILGVIRQLQADVLFLTEVDVGRSRSNYVDQVEYLAQGADYQYYYYAPSLPKGGKYQQDSSKPLNLFGTAILSRFPILEARRHYLPGLFGVEPRVMLEGVLSVYDRTANVFGVHLTVHRKLRRLQVDWLLRKVHAEQGDSQIIIGDFNAPPDSGEIRRITQAGFSDGALGLGLEITTFPAWSPSVQIDYIFLDQSFANVARTVEVPTTLASDHRPYVVEILFP